MKEMFWMLSNSMFTQMPFFHCHFCFRFDSSGVHFEIRGFKRCCLSRQRWIIASRTKQRVSEFKVWTLRLVAILLKTSHQASWSVGFKAAVKRGSVSCVVTWSKWIGIKKKDFFSPFKITSYPKFNINHYDWDEWFVFTCLRVSLLLICLCFCPLGLMVKMIKCSLGKKKQKTKKNPNQPG